jgi:hypothetical protein
MATDGVGLASAAFGGSAPGSARLVVMESTARPPRCAASMPRSGRRKRRPTTKHERLLLRQYATKIRRALVRGFAEHHVGRDDEANQTFVEYDKHMADCFWIWGLVCERVRTGVDNRHITDNWIPPGAVETRVAEVDAQGKPSRLLRVMR